jgi:LL-diaminopimelate aminotransferase
MVKKTIKYGGISVLKEDYIQHLFADRIGGAQFGMKDEIYKFEKIKRAKRKALRENPGKQLIDLGVGEPDAMADDMVIRKLAEEAKKTENRFYADNGVLEFKQAAATYMKEVFEVDNLDPETEINHAIGSKSALAMIPTAFINPGDITIMPSPNYPVLGTHTKYLGGEVVHLPLLGENSFLPKLDSLSKSVLKKAKLLYLNYPNNPTGAVAKREFFEDVVAFAKKHELIVVHDAAYAALVFDGEKPLSFLSVPGAKEIGIELHSLSKSFNMTGWRIGFIAGNSKLVSAFSAVKDNYDSGQFIPIQKAASYALAHPEITEQTAVKYERRHDRLLAILQVCGFTANKPKASFFLYTRIPKSVENGPEFHSAEDFSQFLINEHLISTVPWDDAGPYVRFSVTFQADGIEEERRTFDEISARLSTSKFIF